MVDRPSGIHFRIKVPAEIQDIIGKRELRRSLTSLSHRSAQQEAQRLAVIAKEYFHTVKQSQQSHPQSDGKVWQDHAIRQAEADQFRSEGLLTESEPAALTAMIKAYCEEQVQAGNWTSKTEHENNAIFALLTRIIGDIPCTHITYPVLRKYKTTLIRLPANLNKSPNYRGKTIAELKDMNCKPMSVANMNKNLSRVSSLLRWSVKNGFIKTNFAEGLQIKRTIRSDEERNPYTTEQMNKVFNHPLFTQRDFKHPFQYWVPLLGLYTGARLNELCQLHLNDIYKIDDIWIININADTPDKKLKTRSAARSIPLHSKLISLGFLDYIDLQQVTGNGRVFPELRLSRDGYGQKVSKWYSHFRNKLDLTNDGSKEPDFHSFRHNVSMSLRQKYSLDDIGEILGHHSNSVTARYTKRLTVTQLKAMIESLNYPITL